MRAAAEMLRTAEVAGDALITAGRPLTSEAVRACIREACARAGAQCPPDIMVKPMGPAARIGHYAGFGPLPAHTPILIDLWPQDDESGCWADMTRTFLIGNVPDAIAELYAIVLEAHERTCSSVRPGITGRALYDLACDVFEGAGYPTQRTNAPGETLRSGFYHGLGHGVGLEVHEAPGLGRMGGEELVAGDVVALEPGTVDLELGGARVEDLLVVTEAGAENLTASFPLELRLAG
jgi:Xaa-Pro aminopeptidase